jgi:hypothetical protein
VNETQWRTSTDPLAMLTFLIDNRPRNARRLRLFALACCRRIGHTLKAERYWRIVRIVERIADGLADAGEIQEAIRCFHPDDHNVIVTLMMSDANLSAIGTSENAARWAGIVNTWEGGEYLIGQRTEEIVQCALLRDVYGNPFRPRIPRSALARLAQQPHPAPR